MSSVTTDRGILQMCVNGTPVEYHTAEFGLVVKREDLCCPGGPNFSKTRGVFAHVAARPEGVIGVLDTSHSQGGWAVARACQMLGKRCVLFYPEYKTPRPMPVQQIEAQRLGATLHPLTAGRSAILYHQAKKRLAEGDGGHLMPNALKLPEMVDETVKEVRRTKIENDVMIVAASSATIAAGVLKGLKSLDWHGTLIVHMGYSRPEQAVLQYMSKMTQEASSAAQKVIVVDECYAYKDTARDGPEPTWPCNSHYDLKAFRWWMRDGRREYGQAMLWNIG